MDTSISRSSPFEESVRSIDSLYLKGFKRINSQSEETVESVELAEAMIEDSVSSNKICETAEVGQVVDETLAVVTDEAK